MVSQLCNLEGNRARWWTLTKGTQTLEVVDFVHTLPVVHIRVALTLVDLQFTIHIFETCTKCTTHSSERDKAVLQLRKDSMQRWLQLP